MASPTSKATFDTVEEALALIESISDGDLSARGELSDKGNGVNKIIVRLNTLAENLSVWETKRGVAEDRLNTILESIISISSLQFDHKIEISGSGDMMDAVAVGLNAHGEELEASVISRQFVDNIFASMVDALIVVDKNAEISIVNKATLDLLGYQEEELLQQDLKLIVNDPDINSFSPKDLIKIPYIRDKEITFINKNQIELHVSYSLSVIRDASGGFAGAICVGHDITIRKKIEAERNQRAHIFEHLHSGVAVDNLGNGIIDLINPAFAGMLGYSQSELVGTPVIGVYAKEYREELKENIAEFKKKGKLTFEAKHLHKDGSIIPTLISASSVTDDEDNVLYFVVNVTDISNQKRIEAEIIESEYRYRSLFEQSPFGVMMVDPETTDIIEFNSAMSDIFGYSENDFAKINISDIEFVENKKETRARSKKILIAGQDEFETKIITKIGEIKDVIVNIQVLELAGKKIFLNIIRDVTERKIIEDRIKSSLEEKEVLIKEIHHRVKNNLQIISSLLYLQSKRTEDKNSQAILKDSQNRVKAMELIHEKLYQSADLASVDLGDYLGEIVKSLFKTYGVSREKIKFEVKDDGINMGIDIAIPCGMIVNELVSNALKHAFPHDFKGNISINIERDDDNFCVLKVSDDGIGFPIDRDFNNSDSLGLQLVKNLVEQISGDLQLIQSSKGTEFILKVSKRVVFEDDDAE